MQSSSANRIISVIFLTLLVDLIGFSIIFPLFPSILEYYLQIQTPPSWIEQILHPLKEWSHEAGDQGNFLVTVFFGGCMAALYSILQFIFMPIWGNWSDRIGRKKTILISIAGTSIGYLIWLFAGSFLMLLLSRVIISCMSANIAVASAAIADITQPQNRAKSMAIVGIAFGLGFILGPAIGGIASSYNPLLTYPQLSSLGINPFFLPTLIAFILSIINWVCVFIYFQETLPVSSRTCTPLQTPLNRIKNIFGVQNHQVRHTCWVNFLFILIFSGMEFSLTFLAKERFSFTAQDNGFLFVYIGFMMIIAQGLIIRRFVGIIGEKRLSIIGITLGCIGLFLLAQAYSMGWFLIASGILALSSGLMNALMSLTSLYAHPHQQGRDIGAFRSAGALGRSLGPLAAAILYFKMGAHITYLIGALALIIPWIAAYQLPRPHASSCV